MDPDQLKDRLLFAVPKKGRLYEQCLSLLQGADIQFHRKTRLDIALSTNLPIALVFLPASDIAKFVAEGNVDLGITGQDMIAENGVVVDELLQLGFGKCDLCVQVPQDGPFSTVDDLIGKRVVTSFENLAGRYFAFRETGLKHQDAVDALQNKHIATNSIKTQISFVGGSVEAACALGLADGIVDLVESGETMRAAKLKSIAVLRRSQAVLICNIKKHQSIALIEKIKCRIQGVLAAQKFVLCNYNIERVKLPEAIRITPGKKAPTVSPLENEGWIAVSSMVLKSDSADIMDKLSEIGAVDILIFNIHNCRV